MRWLRQERGFTLVELTIVMAITAVLLLGALAGRGLLFQNTAFTGAMDQAQNTFRQIQNEANQAVSINPTSAGQSAEVIFGRLATLTANSPILKTYTLVGAEDNHGTVVSLAACDEQDTTLQDGLVDPNLTGAQTKSVIFTRRTDQTATDGQLFVAPDDATQGPFGSPQAVCPNSVANPGALPIDTGPPSQGLVTYCDPAMGQVDTHNGTANGQDVCTATTPPAPLSLTVTDAETASATAPGSLNTAQTTLTVTVALPPTPAGLAANETIHIWDSYKGAIPTEFGVSAHPTTNNGSATFTVTLPATDVGSNSLTATWDLGSSNESLPSAAVNVAYNPPPPPTCTASETTPTTYECGLVGSYYRGSAWGRGAAAQTVAIDGAGAGLNIGEQLGGGYAAYANFLPTLETRTGQQIAQTASVTWTGQIYLNPGSQTICLQSDNTNATFTIGSSGDSGSPSPSPSGNGCGSWSGGSAGAWQDITIDYSHSSADGEGTASVRLVSASGSTLTDIDGSRLRYLDNPAVATTGPPSNSAGLTASYYAEEAGGNSCPSGAVNIQTGQSTVETVNGIGNSSSPQTWATNGSPPSLSSYTQYLESKTGANVTTSHLEACFTGYLQIPTSGYYSFCINSDDQGYFYWGDTGQSASDVGSSQSPQFGTPGCTPIIATTAGQHPIVIWDQEQCYCSPNYTGIQVDALQYNSSGGLVKNWGDSHGDIPLDWYTTQNTYLAAGPPQPQPQLPGYQQLVQAVEKAGRQQPDPPNPVAQAKPNGVLQRIARAISPPAAYAAGADCVNDNILDPYNYAESCPDFTAGSPVQIPLAVPGGGQAGNLQFDTTTGTVTWSDN